MHKLKYSTSKWYRGVDQRNVASGDQFFTTDNHIAGDFGKVTELKPSEFPKNPLIISNKDELADLIGFGGDPYVDRVFDDVSKKYAHSKGYDGIIYHSGTFEAPELHIFG